MIKSQNRLKQKSIFENELYIGIFLFIISAVFVTLTSYTTSPVFKGWYENDGKAFLFIAKGMVNGKIPYTDIFDHKGPVLYFIESFGWLLTGGKTGVFFLQIINLFATLFLIFWAAREFISVKASFFTTVAVIPFLTSTLFGGNYSEEWSLSFSAVAVLLACRYINLLNSGKSEHNVFAGGLLGFAFSFTANIRVNNCITVASCVLYIFVCLIINKRFKNLLFNAGAFIVGAALPLLPALVYFGKTGTLDGLLYGSLIFNLKYSGINQLINEHASMSMWTSVFPVLVIAVAAAVYYLFKRKNNKLRYIAWLLICHSMCLFAMYLVTGVTYLHYLAFAWPVPLILYILVILAGGFEFKVKGKDILLKGAAVVACLAVISIYYFNAAIDPSLDSTRRIIKSAAAGEKYELEGFARKVDEIIPEEDSGDVFCLASSFSVLYLYDTADLYPKCRYHLFYDFWKLIDGNVTAEVTEMMKNDPPRWLISKEGDWHDDEISAVIESSYTKILEEQGFILYKKTS
ncbi:MAG: hypothetical protein IJL87_02220 [Clostridia bacterium]|nr:hypothetical protein [Clostridia bacterium]